MTRTTLHSDALEQNTDPPRSRHRAAPLFFRATLLLLAGAAMVLATGGPIRAPQPAAPTVYEIPATALERMLGKAASQAQAAATPGISSLLDTAYAPAYAAIPVYADFHYTLRGQYSALGAAVAGTLDDRLHNHLFDGLEQRLNGVAQLLDQRYTETYRHVLQAEVDSAVPRHSMALPLGEMTQAVLQDAQDRAKITVPLASVAAVAAGRGLPKAPALAFTKRMAAKGTAKGAARGAGVATCALSLPLAVACGAAAWVATDVAFLYIDEYFNRDEFEADLRALLDQDKAAKQRFFEQILEDKTAATKIAMQEVMKDFTLDELSSVRSALD
ncbi:MAG: hypothetical protein WC247_13090 [Porticoccaceae bacterium]